VYMPPAAQPAAHGVGVPVYAPPPSAESSFPPSAGGSFSAGAGYRHGGGAPAPQMGPSGYPPSQPGGVPVYAPPGITPAAHVPRGTTNFHAPPAAASSGVYSGPGINPRLLDTIKEGRGLGEKAQALHVDGMNLRQSGLRAEAGPTFRAAGAAYREALSKLVPCRRELDTGVDASRLVRQTERAKLDKLVIVLMDKLEEITPLATDDVPLLRPPAP
jgi:hypothetical protein